MIILISLQILAIACFASLSLSFPHETGKPHTHIHLVEENTEARKEYVESQRTSAAASILAQLNVKPQTINRDPGSYGRKRRSPSQKPTIPTVAPPKADDDRTKAAANILAQLGVGAQAINRGPASYGRKRRSPTQKPTTPAPPKDDDRTKAAANILAQLGIEGQAINRGAASYGRKRRQATKSPKAVEAQKVPDSDRTNAAATILAQLNVKPQAINRGPSSYGRRRRSEDDAFEAPGLADEIAQMAKEIAEMTEEVKASAPVALSGLNFGQLIQLFGGKTEETAAEEIPK